MSMTLEQEIEQLKSENALLREHLAAPTTLNIQLVARIQALEERLSQDSHNSSKPPSSGGFVRSPEKRSLRKASGKKAGGQSGYSDHPLQQLEHPDEIIEHYPQEWEESYQDLTTKPPLADFGPRQVFELPLPLKLDMLDYRSQASRCPGGQPITKKAPFPALVITWLQYESGLWSFSALSGSLPAGSLIGGLASCSMKSIAKASLN